MPSVPIERRAAAMYKTFGFQRRQRVGPRNPAMARKAW